VVQFKNTAIELQSAISDKPHHVTIFIKSFKVSFLGTHNQHGFDQQ
jgi:hypothetical protein